MQITNFIGLIFIKDVSIAIKKHYFCDYGKTKT